MRDHSNHIEVSREKAIELLLSICRFKPETETVALDDAIGRVLAEDATALLDMPNCLTCRMDSVAVHWDDFENGMPDTSGWIRGRDWEFANTGVGMPEGFDTAITVEHVAFSDHDTKVSFDAMPSARYAGTSEAGSKMRKGDLLVSAGTLITPLLAAHILSGNNTQVSVVKKPVVTFIPTGNELVNATGEAAVSDRLAVSGGKAPSDSPIPRGKNIESNSVMICGKIRQWGGDPRCPGVIKDDPEAIEQALKEAVSSSDIVVLNAGTSKGSDDYSIEVVEKMGRVLYHQTTHGPGHHSWCAEIDGVPVIGISGPPGGASFTTDFYLYPAMMKYLGQCEHLPKIRVRLGADLPSRKFKPSNAPVPAETTPPKPGPFFSVRNQQLQLADDGVLEAVPLHCGRWPSPPEAETCSAYYLMETGYGIEAPKKGEWIEIELRPEYLP